MLQVRTTHPIQQSTILQVIEFELFFRSSRHASLPRKDFPRPANIVASIEQAINFHAVPRPLLDRVFIETRCLPLGQRARPCMDARLDPAKYAGLSEGDAHVIRNAGGGASDDAVGSLVISHKLLGTREWFVVHHTNCGMELFTDDVIGDLLAENFFHPHISHGKAWS